MNSLQDLRTYTGAVRKSSKPDLPTTAILSLYMRRNERDRIVAELARIKKRRGQLQIKLKEIEQEMNKLVEKATQTAVKIRGEAIKGKGDRVSIAISAKKKGKTVVGY